MKRALLASLAVLALASPASATITIDVLNNGSLVGSSTSLTGTATFNSTSIGGYDSVSVDVSGFPNLTGGDLSSTTLDVSSASSAPETLTVEVFQTGIHSNGHVQSTFTVNGLIGSPGPTTTATFFGGTGSTLGTTLASHTFPAGNLVDHFGPVSSVVAPFTADAQAYTVHFAGGTASANDSIELTAGAIPEASTWAMMILGFGVIFLVAGRGRKSTGVRSWLMEA
jgi:hypothetical protein